MVKDKAWLWRTDPVREKKARLMLENITAPSVENMTNEEWKAFNADSRVSFLHSPLSFSSSFPLFTFVLLLLFISQLKHMGKYWGIFDDVLAGNPITPTVNLVAKYANQLVHRGSEFPPTLVWGPFSGHPFVARFLISVAFRQRTGP